MTADTPATAANTLWMVAQYALPPAMTGGTRHYETSMILKEHGWHSRVIASPFNHKTHLMDRPVSLRHPRLDATEEGVEFTWVYSTPYEGNDARRYVNMLSFLATSQIRRPRGERPSVVLGSSPHLLAALSGWITARRYRVPFVMEVRDLWPESLVQLGLTNRAIVKPLEWLETFLYRHADHIVALTEGIRTGIQEKGVAPAKISMIPNGAEAVDPLSATEVAEMRKSLGWQDQFVCGWIGAHGSANSLETIVEAARILQNAGNTTIRFVLVGHGPEKSRLMDMSADLSNMEFVDSLPKKEIMIWLQAMDAGIIVHRDTLAVRGARPNKLFDYMAAGIPIVSDLQGETERLISDANCGVTVPSQSPSSLAAAIIELSSDKEKSTGLGRDGMRFLERTHDRRSLVRDFAEVLNRIVGPPK